MNPEPTRRAERAILAHLAGLASLHEAATSAGMTSSNLTDAARRYQNAGRAVLKAADRWLQVNVEFADAAAAERAAAGRLFPALMHAQAEGHFDAWWFLRKPPGLRIRIAGARSYTDALTGVFDDAVRDGLVTRWWSAEYEPEIAVFGGDVGMNLAHEIFASDSTGITHFIQPSTATSDRVLLSLILMTHLQRAAGLDWNERGDVWVRVAAQRTSHDLPAGDLERLAEQAHTVMTTDTHAVTRRPGAFATVAPWADALHRHGRDLASAAHDGDLTRGLREILSLHVIFHWNRMGLPAATQAVWAAAAAAAVFER